MSESQIDTPFEDEEVRVASETSDSLASLRSEMTDLREKVNRILQVVTAATDNDMVDHDPEDEDQLQEVSKGKSPEKKIAAINVDQSEPKKQDKEHVSAAAQVGKI